ncbi:cache domain-containing protein [Duganella sp. sic0402]|uniref:cache domain-containing protein n=1 Tax=Duganella sp. sic0402 TaxID=2854786 RepID=UPI001C452C46|nr:cache domain-containing protein [Duganella sp. sic0402]MBV7536277.1 cache domain-containing protein [Duganella sp. sic0402]
MKTLFAAAAISFALCGVSSAAERGTRSEAIAMVKKAVAMVKTQGKEQTFAAISDPNNTAFHDRDLYIYVYDFKGNALAHGNNPKMVGKSLIGLKDYESKMIVQDMIKVAKNQGNGWVYFKWPNPLTKTVEAKAGYVERVDDYLIGSGAYQ